MITFLLIICIILSFITIFMGIFLPFETGNDKYFSLLAGGFFGIICTAAISSQIFATKTPTKQDVFDRKAIYQETIHIVNGDTIKTYEIVWK